jgi:hypothetical protein
MLVIYSSSTAKCSYSVYALCIGLPRVYDRINCDVYMCGYVFIVSDLIYKRLLVTLYVGSYTFTVVHMYTQSDTNQ